MLLYSKFFFENQMWQIKRYARKSIYHGCKVWIENLSLGITVQHHEASLVTPISDPSDRFFYPHHTPMKDIYYLILEYFVLGSTETRYQVYWYGNACHIFSCWLKEINIPFGPLSTLTKQCSENIATIVSAWWLTATFTKKLKTNYAVNGQIWPIINLVQVLFALHW